MRTSPYMETKVSLMNTIRLWSFLRRLALALIVAGSARGGRGSTANFCYAGGGGRRIHGRAEGRQRSGHDRDLRRGAQRPHRPIGSRGHERDSARKILAAMQTFRVLREPSADRRVLVIGDEAWPMPIPIVRVGDRWRFATDEGADEIVNRRIGGNERNAIYVLRAYVDAQRAYATRDRDGDDVLQYAQKARQHAGQAGRPVLAQRRFERRRGEPVRPAGRASAALTSRDTRPAIRIAATTSGS